MMYRFDSWRFQAASMARLGMARPYLKSFRVSTTTRFSQHDCFVQKGKQTKLKDAPSNRQDRIATVISCSGTKGRHFAKAWSKYSEVHGQT